MFTIDANKSALPDILRTDFVVLIYEIEIRPGKVFGGFLLHALSKSFWNIPNLRFQES
jgi:hypothetical protein